MPSLCSLPDELLRTVLLAAVSPDRLQHAVTSGRLRSRDVHNSNLTALLSTSKVCRSQLACARCLL